MAAEVIAVGTEITSGAKLDTNSQWLSLRLSEIGIPVHYHTTVADDLEANIAVFRQALQRAELVLVTGGLGPTRDDLTRQALAAALDVDLVLDEESLQQIEERFVTRGRAMTPSNRLQAMFPRGSSSLPNPIGTAPGIWCSLLRGSARPAHLAALPGVPNEMQRMFREQVEPRLTGHLVIRREVVNCFGMGESQTEELLGDLTQRGADPEVGITAHEATISLRIIAQALHEEECQAKVDRTLAALHDRLGDTIFSVGSDELEHVVVRALQERGQSLAICEIGSLGVLANRLMQGGENSATIRGALVLPNLSEAARWLGAVESTEAPASAAEGARLAGQLARAVREHFQADYGLAVTPVGTLPLAGRETQVSCAWAGVSDAHGDFASEARSTSNPGIFNGRTAKVAMDLLRRRLLGLPLPGGG